MTAQTPVRELARGVVESISDHPPKLVLSIPGSEYKLQLTLGVPAAQITTQPGKRISGTIHANALRMFKAVGGGGGRFIEPIWGEPRIVAGYVLAVDEAQRRVLVDVGGVPMWMTLEARQPADSFVAGDLVNCYVASGAIFIPA